MGLQSFRRDEAGATLIEFTVLLPIVISVFFGSVDFLYMMYQWNAAAKAVEVGARIAAVSDPVASGLNGLSDEAILNGSAVGGPMPSFTITCNGSTETCTCSGTCVGMATNSYSSAAMNRLVFGRGSNACGDAKSYYATGMCDVLSSIGVSNVLVIYRQPQFGGLGYSGRPGSPLPTITVALQNMDCQFFFLSYLLGTRCSMPAMTTTITAEDLCSGGSMGSCGS